MRQEWLISRWITLQKKGNASTAYLHSSTFEHVETTIPGHPPVTYTYNQTSCTYLVPVNSPSAKVRESYLLGTRELLQADGTSFGLLLCFVFVRLSSNPI